MSNKIKEKAALGEAANGCPHHWLIESARGATSRGICKYCGGEKFFYNSWADFNAMKRSVSTIGIAELLEAEPEPAEAKPDREKTHAGV